MLIGSLVVLHVGLHSCLCFSLSKNWFLKVARHLLDTLLSVEILQLFLITFPTNPQYLVDQSRKLLPPRQILDTWWIDWASILGSNELFLDTCSIPQLSMTISLIPTSIASSTPASIELYWRSIYTFFAIRFSFLRSFLICPHLFISQTLSLSHSKPLPLWFFKLFQDSSSLGKFLISYSSCILCFET